MTYTQCGINSLEIFSQKFLNKQWVGETIIFTFIIVSKQNSYLITVDPFFWDNELINHLYNCNCNYNNESELKEIIVRVSKSNNSNIFEPAI